MSDDPDLRELGQPFDRVPGRAMSPAFRQRLAATLANDTPTGGVRPRTPGTGWWWVAVGTGFAAVVAVGLGQGMPGFGVAGSRSPLAPAVAMKRGRPVLLDAQPWDILIYPQLLDPGHYLVALRYDGSQPMAAPPLTFSWGRHRAHELLPSKVQLQRRRLYPVAVIEDLTYSQALLQAPIKIVWTADHTPHRTAVTLRRGSMAPVSHALLYTGQTQWWQMSYAAETIHVGPGALPKAVVRLQYRGPGTFGKYVEYSLEAPRVRQFGTIGDSPTRPTRVLRDQVPVVAGHPAQMVFQVKWAGHTQRIVLKPRAPGH